MPASGINCYLHDARNNFDAVRPAPIPTDDGIVLMGQSHNINISTNCYYGYHGTKSTGNIDVQQSTDCEMMEVGNIHATPSSDRTTAKKRSADGADCPQSKRLRQEVQRENIEPETNETIKLETNTEDLLESLYWNIHGGSAFHLIQYDSSICSLVGTRSSPSHSASAFKAKILLFYTLYLSKIVKLHKLFLYC